MPTSVLAARIGHTSPDIATAAPRRTTLTAADLTGWLRRALRVARARPRAPRDVMASLGVADRLVTELAPGEHAAVLLALRDELGERHAVHWEGECPWGDADGLNRIGLDGGNAQIV